MDHHFVLVSQLHARTWCGLQEELRIAFAQLLKAYAGEPTQATRVQVEVASSS